MIKRLAFTVSALVTTASLYAQTCEQADTSLAEAYTQMKNNGSYSGLESGNEIKRDEAEKQFNDALTYLKQDDSWSCSFTKAEQAGVGIFISEDKRLAGFSWDSQNGGTMHEYNTVLKYRDATGKTFVQEPTDGYLTNIYTDNLGKNGTVYILTDFETASIRLRGQSLRILQIQGDKLVPLNIIQTSKPTHSLSYEYSTAFDDNTNEDFNYDAKSKTISFPLVPQLDKNDPGYNYGSAPVSGKRIKYHFNGTYFIRQK